MRDSGNNQRKSNLRWLSAGLALLCTQTLLIAEPEPRSENRLIEMAPYLHSAVHNSSQHIFQITSPLNFFQKSGMPSPALSMQAKLQQEQAPQVWQDLQIGSVSGHSEQESFESHWMQTRSNPLGPLETTSLLDEDSPANWVRRTLGIANLRYYFNRLVIQVDLARLQRQFTGPFQSGALAYSSIKIGYGLGTARTKQNAGDIHYPVTMLVGIASRQTDYDHLEGEEISGSRSNNLFFTPGLAVGSRYLSVEASLEVPIARYTPESEDRLSGQVRANVGMTYRLK